CVAALVVSAREPVVVFELVFTICRDERGLIGIVAGIATEHREERDSDAGQPLFVRRRYAAEPLERVAGGVEDQLDRVDERSVEIKQDGGEGSAGSRHGYQRT